MLRPLARGNRTRLRFTFVLTTCEMRGSYVACSMTSGMKFLTALDSRLTACPSLEVPTTHASRRSLDSSIGERTVCRRRGQKLFADSGICDIHGDRRQKVSQPPFVVMIVNVGVGFPPDEVEIDSVKTHRFRTVLGPCNDSSRIFFPGFQGHQKMHKHPIDVRCVHMMRKVTRKEIFNSTILELIPKSVCSCKQFHDTFMCHGP